MKLTTSTFSKLTALAAGFALSGLALTACNNPTSEKTPTIAFSFPTSGEILHQSDNTDPTSPAGTIQVTVTLATTSVSSGSKVTLTVDGSAATPSTVGSGGKVSFAGVSLAGSAAGTSHSLQAGVSDSGGNGTASATVTVSVVLSGSTNSCTVTLAPVSGTIFNETGATVSGQTTVKDEDTTTPGMQAKITVTTNCADGTSATLTAGSTQIGTGTVSGGQVIFDGVTLTDTPVAALNTPSLRLQITASVGTAASGGSATAGYIVDSSTPTCTITAPNNGATFTAADIVVAGSTQGFVPQIAAGIAAAVSIVDGSGNSYGSPTQLSAAGTFSADISLLNGTDVLICQATTATGNVAQSSPVSVTANIPLSIAITLPTAGEVFNILDDEQPSQPGLVTDLHLSTTAGSGSAITICSTVAPPVSAATCTFGTGTGFVVAMATSAGATQVLSAQMLGEGDQTLTAQISQNGQTATSTPVPISVHTTRPSVTSLTFSPEYTDADGGLWLNSTNLSDGGAATVATVVLDSSDTFVSDGGAQMITLVVPATSQVLGTGPVVVNGSTAQAQIPLVLADGVYAMEARVSDLWGNPNYDANLTPALTSTEADATLGVKTSLPSCSFTGPSGLYFNVADNGGVAATGNVNLPVTLSTANGFATVNGSAVAGSLSVGLSGSTTTTLPVTSSAIAAPLSAPQGLDTVVATITDPAGNPPQACAPSLSITVATEPPTLAIAPTTSWSPPPDAGANPPEYTATRSFQIPVTTNVPDGTLVTSTLNGLTDGTGTVASGAATLPENGLNGTDTFVVSVQDAAGNVTTQQATVQVNDPLGCGLFFSTPASSPAYFNAKSGTVTAGTLSTSIVLESDCPAMLVTLTKTPSTGTPVVTTQLTNGAGVATFAAMDFADGETGTLSASIGLGVVTTAGPLTYYTKLTTPNLTAPRPASSPTWIVANSGNPNTGSTVSGTLYLASTTAYSGGGNPYANVTFAVTAANLGPSGGSSLGTAALHLGFAGSTSPPSQSLTTDPQTVTFGPINLPPDAASAPVTLTITDAAGNATVQSWTVETTVIPPGAPSVTPTVMDERRATVKLAWNAPANGTGNAVTGYDLRWSLPAQGWGASLTDTQFFAATGVTQDTGINSLPGATPGSAQSYNLTALPPFNSWAISLRSVDAAGNRSEPIVVNTVNDNTIALNPAQNWNQVTLVETSGNYFGYEMISADFNGDGLSDLAISDPQFTSTPGTVWIVSGNANPTKMTLASALTLQGPTDGTSGSTASDDFGNNLAAGDFTGTGFPALAAGSLGWTGCQGRVDIYLSGGAGGLASTPALELQGAPGSSECFGSTVRSLGDVDGDGLPDLFVSAPFNGSRFTNAQGNGYIFFSSSLKKDVAAGTTTVVPLTAADLVFNGNNAQEENFGYRSAAFSLGTGFFFLPASGASLEYAFAPSAVLPSAASNNGGIAKPIAATSASFTLTNGEGLVQQGGASNFYDSFGTAGIGGVSFTGGATPDVVVSSAIPNNVYLYTTTASGVDSTPVATLNQPSSDLGWMMVAVDINGDGKQDLIVGSNSPSDYGAFIYLNQGNSPYFVNTPSAVVQNGSDSYFGYGVATGNFQVAGSGDLAIADGFTTAVIFY